ncbi:MAG: hypothetical protein LH615_03015 [Ferruginibacter sp.]|nr:hypothetical protein [Ferruginibacter sp.]
MLNNSNLFYNRKALIVTKHNKEKVIVPILQEALGLDISIATKVDTDQFGTFSGEIERPDTQYNTAKLKILKAFELYPEAEIAIASEGAFNPHPDCPFIPLNTEVVLLIDRKNQLEISGKYLSLAANVKEEIVSSMKEALDFAEILSFPQNGIILKAGKNKNNKPYIFKDATTTSCLEAALLFFFEISDDGKITMQSDMRAHLNPVRMENIRLATVELLKTIQSVCPVCNTPGFDVKEVFKGLPCSLCNAPTRSTLSYIYECKKCKQQEEKLYPHGKQQEDPGLCDYCNP